MGPPPPPPTIVKSRKTALVGCCGLDLKQFEGAPYPERESRKTALVGCCGLDLKQFEGAPYPEREVFVASGSMCQERVGRQDLIGGFFAILQKRMAARRACQG